MAKKAEKAKTVIKEVVKEVKVEVPVEIIKIKTVEVEKKPTIKQRFMMSVANGVVEGMMANGTFTAEAVTDTVESLATSMQSRA